ncbi:MAG: hypothetical protein ABDH37_09115, partial [Candidatus Hydrothermales bacterium]
DQEEYLRKVIERLEENALPKKTVQNVLNALKKLSIKEIQNPVKVIDVLQTKISTSLLESHYVEANVATESETEVILSLYLTEMDNNIEERKF